MHIARSNGKHLLLTESEEFALLTLGMCIVHLKSFYSSHPGFSIAPPHDRQKHKTKALA